MRRDFSLWIVGIPAFISDCRWQTYVDRTWYFEKHLWPLVPPILTNTFDRLWNIVIKTLNMTTADDFERIYRPSATVIIAAKDVKEEGYDYRVRIIIYVCMYWSLEPKHFRFLFSDSLGETYCSNSLCPWPLCFSRWCFWFQGWWKYWLVESFWKLWHLLQRVGYSEFGTSSE